MFSFYKKDNILSINRWLKTSLLDKAEQENYNEYIDVKDGVTMRIKEGFIIRQAADSFVVMQIGGEVDFNGMITLNETGAFIWNSIANGLDENQIATKLTEEYDTDFENALSDVKTFISKMKEVNVIE